MTTTLELWCCVAPFGAVVLLALVRGIGWLAGLGWGGTKGRRVRPPDPLMALERAKMRINTPVDALGTYSTLPGESPQNGPGRTQKHPGHK